MTYLDVMANDGDILEVEGGIDLVHHIQGGGLVVVQGKHQGEGTQCLLPARQVGDVLPGLLRGTHTDSRRQETVLVTHQCVTCCQVLVLLVLLLRNSHAHLNMITHLKHFYT